MKRIIGVDIDGVLADFNAAFINLVIQETGRDLFPPRPFDIPLWNYPEHYGYDQEEIAKVWGVIEHSPIFWQTLPYYPDTYDSAKYLRQQMELGHDVYFVTSRPGLTAKVQTERWLRRLALSPTVLISSLKGLCAKALRFDAYIDDKWENAVDAARTGTATTLLSRPWNAGYDTASFGIVRTSTVVGFVGAPVAADAASPRS